MKVKINNLKELQQHKNRLKSQRKSSGNGNPLNQVKSVITQYKSVPNLNAVASMNRNDLMDTGVKTTLTLAAGTIVSRFRLGAIPKLLLTIAVTAATPIIVDQIQKKMNKR